MTPLCETVTGRSMAELLAARDAAVNGDMVELRLDGVANLDVGRALEGRRVPAIVTCRAMWEGGRFVSTSALIVPPRFRGRGLARLLKESALRLMRKRYPGARPFGLSTSPAVVKINRELGLREARYAELPRDPEFWKGCESCPFHAHLIANRGKTCHCTAMLRK